MTRAPLHTRRQVVQLLAAASAAPLVTRRAWARPAARFGADPFTLGVASGDPDATSVVLWTRLAPRPLEPGGGLPPEAYEVTWELADDEGFTRPRSAGRTVASPQLGHSVHVEVAGLAPDRWYWYRFRAGDATSPIGRTRTLPAADADVPRLHLAVTSCQNYEQGLFTAYEQMMRDEPDLVLHLGDYIYEYEAGRNGKIRTHLGREIESLEDYRIRHAQYRSDPLLSGMHARCPWFVTWDDHEFDNNCADLVSEEPDIDPAAFARRRADAYQAYYEAMPLRAASLPRAHHMQLYRRAAYGRLAELLVLDTRQYRSDQPNDDKRSPLNDAAFDPRATLLGAEQRAWLQQRLLASSARWNVLAQQVMMGMVGVDRDGVPTYSMDQWPGYGHERSDLVRFLAERRVPNPVVLTGDIHSNWANELRIDDRQPDATVVASEFVATSLSSGGNGVAVPERYDELRAANPCVRFHNRERGYVRCAVTPKEWRADFVVVDDVERPGGRSFTRASFVVETGSPRVHEG